MFESIKISPTYNIHTASVNYNRSKEMLTLAENNRLDLKHLNNISNESRKAEWLFIREIICKTMPIGEDIIYDVHRKPRFKNSKFYLSISHSQEKVAVAINEAHETGVDLQYITEKIVRIKTKFLNEDEQDRTSVDALELTCYWSIKEALFKIYGKKDAFLKENFEIQEFKFNGTQGSAIGITRANGNESFQAMEFRKIDDYILAYSVNH